MSNDAFKKVGAMLADGNRQITLALHNAARVGAAKGYRLGPGQSADGIASALNALKAASASEPDDALRHVLCMAAASAEYVIAARMAREIRERAVA